jgi:hypothetical protein
MNTTSPTITTPAATTYVSLPDGRAAKVVRAATKLFSTQNAKAGSQFVGSTHRERNGERQTGETQIRSFPLLTHPAAATYVCAADGRVSESGESVRETDLKAKHEWSVIYAAG